MAEITYRWLIYCHMSLTKYWRTRIWTVLPPSWNWRDKGTLRKEGFGGKKGASADFRVGVCIINICRLESLYFSLIMSSSLSYSLIISYARSLLGWMRDGRASMRDDRKDTIKLFLWQTPNCFKNASQVSCSQNSQETRSFNLYQMKTLHEKIQANIFSSPIPIFCFCNIISKLIVS